MQNYFSSTPPHALLSAVMCTSSYVLSHQRLPSPPPLKLPPPQRGDQLSTVSCLAFCVEMSILVGQRNLRWGRRGGGVAAQSWMAGSPKERTQADWLWWLTSHSAGANGFGGPALRKPAGKLQREDSAAAASAGASCASSNVLRFYSSVRLGSPLRTSTVANSFISKSRLMAYPDSVDFLYTLSGKRKKQLFKSWID